MVRMLSLTMLGLLAVLALGCGDDDGATDSGAPDSGRDSGPDDPDTGPRPDSGPRDSGPPDAGCTDCGVVALVAGQLHNCVLRENGSTACWGKNTDAELGDGAMRHGMNCGDGLEDDCNSNPTPTLGITDAVEISAHGGPSTCVRNMAGAVTCWGTEWIPRTSGVPRLRQFEPFSAGIPDAIDLGNGNGHFCAVKMDGTVIGRGSNGSGQLGDGSRIDRVDPVAVMTLTDVIDVEVGASSSSTCARTDTAVFCWGANDTKQIGDGAVVHEICM